MTTQAVTVNFDLRPIRARFHIQLQKQLDVIRLLDTGVNVVTEKDTEANRAFMSLQIGPKLDHPEVGNTARSWLLNAFLRDAIEITGLFLDECLLHCHSIRLCQTGCTLLEMQEMRKEQPKKLAKLHFPQKIERLEKEFGVVPLMSQHALALNRVRTCIVHRNGRVTKTDDPDGLGLEAKFRTLEMFSIGEGTGSEVIFTGPNQAAPENSSICVRLKDYTHVFRVGEQIAFTSAELFSTLITFWQFGESVMQAITDYAVVCGARLVNDGSGA